MAPVTSLASFSSGARYDLSSPNQNASIDTIDDACTSLQVTDSIPPQSLLHSFDDLPQIKRELDHDAQLTYERIQISPSTSNTHSESASESTFDTNTPLQSNPNIRGRGRRRGRGAGRIANRSIRTSVTFQHKLEVIDYYEAHEKDINATIQKFYAHLDPLCIASRKRQIYKWVKCRDTIEEMCFRKATAHQTRRRYKGTATTLSDEAEQQLITWIRYEQDRNRAVSKQMLKVKALEIAEKYDIPKGTFQATWTWQKGFFKRHKMAL